LTEVLLHSVTGKLRSEGKTDFAKVIHDISEGSPTRATKYRRSLDSVNTNIPFTNDEALSLFIELGLSQSKYQQLRNAHLQKKSKMIPSYKKLCKAKLLCYPDSGLSITINEAEVLLQPLLDHTIERIIHYQTEVIKTLSEKKLENLTLIGKWGCDGSSGHSKYKQKLDENSSSDESIFFTSYVPLQLVHIDSLTKETIIVWKNPRPSSPRYCRPIKIECAKESVDLIKKTSDYVEQQIMNLSKFSTTINGKKICVSYILTLTMIDTKVCNSLSETTSAMRCYLCNCTSKNFNDIDKMLSQEIITDRLKFGLSSLHCWIRCFEFLLHLSYKLDTLKWQARSKIEKELVEKRKRNIQAAFKTELGLNVDKPKAGCGTSNDGNTARCFFEKYQKSAQITGIDQDIIHGFYIILQAISCGYDINVDNFRKYAVELARKIVKSFDWYYMPTLVHKLLLHSPEIILHAVLPIGQMSEDAQEACNKFFRIYRLQFARKNYRQKTMEDVFKRFLVSSDPYISSCRKLPVKPLKYLSMETINLLSPPHVNIQKEEQEMVESSSDSESDTDLEAYDSCDNENFFL